MKESINEAIIALWNKYFATDEEVYAPLFYTDLKKQGLLFVGMNPSFSERGFSRFLKGSTYEGMDPKDFFLWKNVRQNPARVMACAEIDRLAHTTYPNYFGVLRDIAQKVRLEREHIDLFLYRETNQSSFESRILSKGKLNDFAKDRLNLFRQVVEGINPKGIVINNARGSKIVLDYFKDDLAYDSETGCHLLTTKSGKIPVFFSSMLSGQRSLDVHSRERLVWHIKKVLA